MVEKEAYAQELSRYIHLNPLRAGLVKDVSDYRWSSYPCYIGLRKCPIWLERGMILGYFGEGDKKAFRGYRTFVEGEAGTAIRDPLREVVASIFLGSQEFIKRVSRGLEGKRGTEFRDVPALRALRERPSLGEVQKVVEEVIGSKKSYLRNFSLYNSHRFGGYSLREIGEYWGMKGAAVSQAARRFGLKIDTEKSLQRIQKQIFQRLSLLNVET